MKRWKRTGDRRMKGAREKESRRGNEGGGREGGKGAGENCERQRRGAGKARGGVEEEEQEETKAGMEGCGESKKASRYPSSGCLTQSCP